jgi:hyperosmotically inducible protein
MIRIKIDKTIILGAILAICLFVPAGTAAASTPRNQTKTLVDEVRHQILLLPYYGMFDNITFTIQDQNTVALAGQVTRPIVRYDAEAAVRSIEGVKKVVNKIEVLPLSSFDNHIRWATYRAIFSKPGFEKYAIQATSPIRIIVKNGHVTLDGFVDSKLDKNVADVAARSVPGVFSVTDNLQVG